MIEIIDDRSAGYAVGGLEPGTAFLHLGVLYLVIYYEKKLYLKLNSGECMHIVGSTGVYPVKITVHIDKEFASEQDEDIHLDRALDESPH